MVEHGSCRAWRAVDDFQKTIDFHQCGKGVFSFGDFDSDDAICRAFDGLRRLCFISRSRSLSLSKGRHDVNALINARSRIRKKLQHHQLLGVSLIRRTHLGHGFLANAVEDEGEGGGARHRLRIVDHDLRSFLFIEKLGTEGPSRAYEEVASQVEGVGFVEAYLEHINPFVAEPWEGGFAETVAIGREGDGVDFHAADASLFQETQLAYEFIGLHLVAVPPPAHEGTVLRGGLLEFGIHLFHVGPLLLWCATAE